MPKLIRIISITNAHQWDGLVMTSDDFCKLKEVLELSRYTHVINSEEVE